MSDFNPAQALRNASDQQLRDYFSRVFAGPIGQTVLLDILRRAGVAHRREAGLGLEARAYHDGRSDLALEIMDMVGLDPVGAALGVMTEDLKGMDYGRREQPELG